MDFSKLIQHPDRDEIVDKLLNGNSAKSVADWLKLKYPGAGNGHLHLPVKLLKEFPKSGYEQFKNSVRKDLELIKNKEKPDSKIAKSLRENKSLNERFEEELGKENKELDLKKTLHKGIIAIQARAEQVFDKIQQDPSYVGNAEYALIKWFDSLFSSVKKYDEIFNKPAANAVTNTMYVEEHIGKYMFVVQQALRNALAKVSPEIALQLVDEINKEMQKINLKEKSPEELLDASIKELSQMNSEIEQEMKLLNQ